jgi:diphosphomevalonate decarboxylase
MSLFLPKKVQLWLTQNQTASTDLYINKIGEAFAPSNIALIKYWGKRDETLNLPLTDSLSISLGNLGAQTKISLHTEDQFILNNEPMQKTTAFSQKLSKYLDYIRPNPNFKFLVESQMNIPMGAGVASSACGFAAMAMALDKLFHWNLSKSDLSILARLGSGSACRSIQPGFIHWKQGLDLNGLDSFGHKLAIRWPELRVGLLLLSENEKKISSRAAMRITKQTSTLYKQWPSQIKQDLKMLQAALLKKDFKKLGSIAQKNAIAMHATMHDSQPEINYDLELTRQIKNQILRLQKKGADIFFTQDAGANLKLLFLEKDSKLISSEFPKIKVIKPFPLPHVQHEIQ